MAQETFTGPTAEAAQQAAWTTFKGRLPDGLRPGGDTPTAEAQEKNWGADDKNTMFRKLMNQTKRARDSGWHTPDQSHKENRGDDRIDELSKGNSHIGEYQDPQGHEGRLGPPDEDVVVVRGGASSSLRDASRASTNGVEVDRGVALEADRRGPSRRLRGQGSVRPQRLRADETRAVADC